MNQQLTDISGVSVSTQHFIGGEWVSSPETFENVSPIDCTVLAEVCRAGESEVDAAVKAARDAFPAWAALGPEGRLPILKQFAQGILDRIEDLAIVDTLDNGSLLTVNTQRLVPRSAENITFFADWALNMTGRTIESGSLINNIRYEPAGVAALIAPWNAPLMLTSWKLGPALAAGNTVVMKPPEWAPLSSSLLADIATDAGIPAGVVNMIQGEGATTGNLLVNHPDINRISFTGSTATARIIGQAAARNLVPMSAELGGKSAIIVCADSDLEAAAQGIAGQYLNAGQVCLAGTRLLVERSVSDRLLDMVRTAVGKIILGDPRDPGTRMGPLISKKHFERVAGFVDRARADGAEILWGGKGHGFGELYYEPTMIAGVHADMEIVQEEVFGPVLTWRTFDTDEEAIVMANETSYGLGGALFCLDERRAMKMAEKVTTGTIWVNCFYVRDLAAPFGGVKNSGIGREGGDWSFDFYCDIKNLSVMKNSFRNPGQ